MTEIVIVSAARTPVGSFNGALSGVSASELGSVAISAAVARANIAMSDVDEVILGQVLQAGAGQGPARQAAVRAGVPHESPAWSLNLLCGSGLRAVARGMQQIAPGESQVVVAGRPVSLSPTLNAAHFHQGHEKGGRECSGSEFKVGHGRRRCGRVEVTE